MEYIWYAGSTDQEFIVDGPGVYWVGVSNLPGCQTIDEIVIQRCPAKYFMPNAFSPNGDGLNDLFNVTGSFSEIQYFSMQIYDRWGLMIQETNDSLEGWNGRMNNHGDLLNEGVYVYTLTIHDLGYNVFHLKGFVVLLK